jgi:hypothetical protein
MAANAGKLQDSKDESDGGKRDKARSDGPREHDSDRSGASQDIADDEVDEIGNLGNEDDDPEGWMLELVDYWVKLPPDLPPSRKAWLRWRVQAAKETLAAFRSGEAKPWPTLPSESYWRGETLTAAKDFVAAVDKSSPEPDRVAAKLKCLEASRAARAVRNAPESDDGPASCAEPA